MIEGYIGLSRSKPSSSFAPITLKRDISVVSRYV